jgi:putative ABC transport system substrate-binding protein
MAALVVIIIAITAVLALPITVDAEPTAALPRVATLGSEPTQAWDVFHRRLGELGYVEGRNVVFERRWTHGFTERVPTLVTELLNARPDVVVTSMFPPARPMPSAPCPPMLVIGVAEPYGACQFVPVASMSLAQSARELSGTHFRLATIAMPTVSRVAVVTDSTRSFLVEYVTALKAAGAARGVLVRVLDATEFDLDGIAAAMTRLAPDVLVIAPGFSAPHIRREIVGYAARRRILTIGSHVADGVAIAADYDWPDLARRAADFVDRILKGGKVQELRTDASLKLEVVVDREATTALGLSLPESLFSEPLDRRPWD